MTRVEREELAERLVRILEDNWAARMLSPGEKATLATELAERLCEGPAWMVRNILARKAPVPEPTVKSAPEDFL